MVWVCDVSVCVHVYDMCMCMCTCMVSVYVWYMYVYVCVRDRVDVVRHILLKKSTIRGFINRKV